MKTIHPAEGKIGAHHSPPVPIMTVHEAKNEDKKNTSDMRQFMNRYHALLGTTTSGEPKYITAGRKVVLKAMCETSVVVATQAAGLIE